MVKIDDAAQESATLCNSATATSRATVSIPRACKCFVRVDGGRWDKYLFPEVLIVSKLPGHPPPLSFRAGWAAACCAQHRQQTDRHPQGNHDRQTTMVLSCPNQDSACRKRGSSTALTTIIPERRCQRKDPASTAPHLTACSGSVQPCFLFLQKQKNPVSAIEGGCLLPRARETNHRGFCILVSLLPIQSSPKHLSNFKCRNPLQHQDMALGENRSWGPDPCPGAEAGTPAAGVSARWCQRVGSTAALGSSQCP